MAPRSLGDGQTDGIIEPSALADTVVDAMREERFHVLPHPEVEEYVRRKGDNIDRWTPRNAASAQTDHRGLMGSLKAVRQS